MPDETTNTDTPAPAPIDLVVAEPSIVAEPEPVAVVEPVIESASLGTPEEVSATRIDAFPDAPLSENIDSPAVETVVEPSVVAEQPVVAETTPVAIVPTPVADVPVGSAVVEQVVAVEQPGLGVSEETSATRTDAFPGAPLSENISSPMSQEPVVPQSGDLGLTPQLPVNEALTSEGTPEKQPAEQPSAPVVFTPEPIREPVKDSVPLKNIARELLIKARNSIQFRKRKKLDRIMGLFVKQVSVTNDDAEKLLHISDATASRYLGILEKESKVKQVGRAGRWVSYTKV